MVFKPQCSGKESACSAGGRRWGFDPWIRKIPWRKKCQPTPVFLPGEAQGQRTLAGYGSWGHRESDTTEQLSMHTWVPWGRGKWRSNADSTARSGWGSLSVTVSTRLPGNADAGSSVTLTLRTCPWCLGHSMWVIPVSALLAFASDLLVHLGMTVCLLMSRFVHPRFGPIKCIRTLRAVEANEELTVAYGYDHSPPGKSGPEAPEWYQVELKAFQATQQKWKTWLRASGDLE